MLVVVVPVELVEADDTGGACCKEWMGGVEVVLVLVSNACNRDGTGQACAWVTKGRCWWMMRRHGEVAT